MSAETLRRAAALIRERAEAAHPSPWKKHHHVPGTVYTARAGYPTSVPYDADADHIASWHPAVALAVADWLDASADHADATDGHCVCDDAALAVARAYLGGDE